MRYDFSDDTFLGFGRGADAASAQSPETGDAKGKEQDEDGKDLIGESAGESGADFGDMQLRALAMGAVLTWLEDGDYSYKALDELVIGVADLDGDGDLTEEEKGVYEDVWNPVADALLSLGADENNVADFINDEDDDAGEKLGGFLSGVMEGIASDDDEIVALFAEGSEGSIFESAKDEDGEDLIGEAAFKKVKVVRNGKVVIKKKRISGKVRLSAAQKAGLKKARRKAHTSAARLKRKKAMKVRKSRGL